MGVNRRHGPRNLGGLRIRPRGLPGKFVQSHLDDESLEARFLFDQVEADVLRMHPDGEANQDMLSQQSIAFGGEVKESDLRALGILYEDFSEDNAYDCGTGDELISSVATLTTFDSHLDVEPTQIPDSDDWDIVSVTSEVSEWDLVSEVGSG